jgi:Immunity protein 32
MITVELKDGDEVEVHLDAEGLSTLMAQLRFLETGKTDHVHLMTASWGGSELTEELQCADTSVIHHLKILRRD